MGKARRRNNKPGYIPSPARTLGESLRRNGLPGGYAVTISVILPGGVMVTLHATREEMDAISLIDKKGASLSAEAIIAQLDAQGIDRTQAHVRDYTHGSTAS